MLNSLRRKLVTRHSSLVTMLNDFRFAIRTLRKNHGFGMVVALASENCESITDYEEVN